VASGQLITPRIDGVVHLSTEVAFEDQQHTAMRRDNHLTLLVPTYRLDPPVVWYTNQWAFLRRQFGRIRDFGCHVSLALNQVL
jgi:hypothetical protein